MLLPFRAVIFDFDGTLIDSFPAVVRAWNAAFEPLSGRTWTTDEVIAHFGVPDVPMVRGALPAQLSEAQRLDALERYFAGYEQAQDAMTPFEGVSELLSALAARGVPMGLMTGKGSRATHITLRHFGWEKFFASIVTGDDVAEQKPHPEGVLRVARELGIEPAACVYVGDSPADVGAAERAGMFSIVAGWHSYYFEPLRALKPNLWPHTPQALRDWTTEHVEPR